MQLGDGLACISLTILYNGWPLITYKSLVSWPFFLEDYSCEFNYKKGTNYLVSLLQISYMPLTFVEHIIYPYNYTKR